MQDRIDRLEGLVLSVMTNGAQSGRSAAAAEMLSNARDAASESQEVEDDRQMRERHLQEDSDIELSRSVGVMKVQNDKQFFASEAHWWAILSDVRMPGCWPYGSSTDCSYRLQKSRVISQSIENRSKTSCERLELQKWVTRLSVHRCFSKGPPSWTATRFFPIFHQRL